MVKSTASLIILMSLHFTVAQNSKEIDSTNIISYADKFVVKINADLEFGDPKDIINEFQYLMDTTETMWGCQMQYFYRVTDDNYIQLAYSLEGSDLKIIAQYKLRHQNLKDNILFIVKRNIEAHLPYDGFPIFENSVIFTKQEFDGIIQTIKDEKLAVINKAKKLETSFIAYLREVNLNPRPTGNTKYSWVASCPFAKGKHFIMVSTLNDDWGCGYCGKGGNQLDLDKWLKEIKIK